MTVKTQVFSDYVCPYCFLAEFRVEAAIKEKDVEVEWMPFELRPYAQPALKSENIIFKWFGGRGRQSSQK